MAYIPQVIVFILALMGILFKSVKTNDEGKTIYTKHGIPVLTRTGVVVIILLTISFIASVFSTLQKSKSDVQQKTMALEQQDKLNEQLNDVRQQNEGLKAGIREAIGASASLSDEQKRSFTSLLTEQKQTGEGIANKINESSTILRGGINESLDLLQVSRREIERAGNPIKDVLVSFAAEVPMQGPELSSYRNRVTSSISEHLKNEENYGRVENGIDVTAMDLVKGYARQVSLDSTSTLIPNPKTDQHAFALLNCVAMDISIYKTPVTQEQITNLYRAPILDRIKKASLESDLWFPISACLVAQNAKYDWATSSLEIFYNIEHDSFGITANDLITNPANWVRNNKISSIPDLHKSLIVIHLREKEPDLFHFGIKMSGGIKFMFRDNNLKRYADQFGYPYYIGQFP
jgi:hypothetical protein